MPERRASAAMLRAPTPSSVYAPHLVPSSSSNLATRMSERPRSPSTACKRGWQSPWRPARPAADAGCVPWYHARAPAPISSNSRTTFSALCDAAATRSWYSSIVALRSCKRGAHHSCQRARKPETWLAARRAPTAAASPAALALRPTAQAPGTPASSSPPARGSGAGGRWCAAHSAWPPQSTARCCPSPAAAAAAVQCPPAGCHALGAGCATRATQPANLRPPRTRAAPAQRTSDRALHAHACCQPSSSLHAAPTSLRPTTGCFSSRRT